MQGKYEWKRTTAGEEKQGWSAGIQMAVTIGKANRKQDLTQVVTADYPSENVKQMKSYKGEDWFEVSENSWR